MRALLNKREEFAIPFTGRSSGKLDGRKSPEVKIVCQGEGDRISYLLQQQLRRGSRCLKILHMDCMNFGSRPDLKITSREGRI